MRQTGAKSKSVPSVHQVVAFAPQAGKRKIARQDETCQNGIMICPDMNSRFKAPAMMVAVLLLLLAWLTGSSLAGPAREGEAFASAVAKINDAHLRQPGRSTESQLAKQLPASAKSALQRLLEAKTGPELVPALLRCGEAALDLDLMEEFAAVRTRLAAVDAAAAAKLGDAVSRPRLIVRGVGDFGPRWLERFADVCEAVLTAYDEVFAFAEFSKVPGKKLRFRVHLEQAITRPPHFAPEFSWHSEVDFPVADGQQFSSPTPEGHFLLYGLCHELGHVIAMWGDSRNMEDKHAWAHYTGVVIVEHLSRTATEIPWIAQSGDVKWRSLKVERGLPDNRTPPSLVSQGSVMALLIALHDSAGPKMIGKAINDLESAGKCRRINQVRYYAMEDFHKALLAVVPDKKTAINAAFRTP